MLDSIISFFTNKEPAFYVEIVLLCTAFVLQIYLLFEAIRKIKTVKKIFSKDIQLVSKIIDKRTSEIQEDVFTEEGAVDKSKLKNKRFGELTLLKVENGSSRILKQIAGDINNYLSHNFGAIVNFSIIKDIIDREVEVHDDEVNQSIPLPLYLGLTATIIGIILGLWSMPTLNMNISKVGNDFTLAINSLIDGVKVAMLVSLSGLLITSILSYWYKNIISKTLNNKNRLISVLQGKLLPELIKAEDSGVSGLKNSLNLFSRKATSIIGEIKEVSFNTSKNIKNQNLLLDKLERLDISRLVQANAQIFDKFEANMSAFQHFTTFLGKMGVIADNLNKFSDRTNDVEHLITQINGSLTDSSKLTKFLTEHLSKIENVEQNALSAVNKADKSFDVAITNLKTEIVNRTNTLNSAANSQESQLEKVYNDIGEKLKSITALHINKLSAAYQEAVPNFQHLENLQQLPPLKDSILEKSEELKSNNSNNQRELITTLNNINNTLIDVQSELKKKKVTKYVVSKNGKEKQNGEGETKRQRFKFIRKLFNFSKN